MAAGLEATDDAAEVFVHLFLHEEDAVEMVGHHLESNDFHLGVIIGDSPPLIVHTLTEGSEFHPGCIGTARNSVAMTTEHTEERTAPFGHHRHHVHHAVCIVVVYTATEHGRLLLASENTLLFIGLSVHGHKGTAFSRRIQILGLFFMID